MDSLGSRAESVQFLAYNAGMEGFGRALKRLRGARKAPAVARLALGDAATPKEVKNFANYIHRIEREEPALTNPSLDVLRRLSTGLGFEHVSQFLQQIEALQRGTQTAPTRPLPTDLSAHGAYDQDRPVPVVSLREVFLALADVFNDAAESPRAQKSRPTAGASHGKASKR